MLQPTPKAKKRMSPNVSYAEVEVLQFIGAALGQRKSNATSKDADYIFCAQVASLLRHLHPERKWFRCKCPMFCTKRCCHHSPMLLDLHHVLQTLHLTIRSKYRGTILTIQILNSCTAPRKIVAALVMKTGLSTDLANSYITLKTIRHRWYF